MGRTPPWARRLPSLSAAALLAIVAAAMPAPGASGKPPWAGGGPPGHGAGHGGPPPWAGNGHGQGHGAAPAPAAAAPVRVPYVPAPAHGHGHAYGHSHSNGNAAARAAAATPAPSPPAPAPAAPAPSPAVPVHPPAHTPGRRQTRTRHGHRRTQRARHARTRRSGTRRARMRRQDAALRAHAAATARRAATGAPVAASGAAATPAGSRRPDRPAHREHHSRPPAVVRTLERVVRVIPAFVKAIVVVLAFLLIASALAWFLLARTTRYLRRQREMLLGEIGTLQGALLPTVPAELSRLHASVAYRPAEGLAAGGDFYDAFPLEDGRVGIVVGDVAGHGKEALMHTALLRYTLRAYLEAGLEPRVALQVAGRSLDRGFDTLATVVLAVYDPSVNDLRYASAGHPPPVFLGEADHVPVTQASSPPIGAGLATGLRQTTVSLPSGSAVCFFTDGLIEARRDGALIGRLGLVDIIRALGPEATAADVLDRVAATADQITDDMAACMFQAAEGPSIRRSPRIEEIEVRRGENLDVTLGRFLAACEVDRDRIGEVVPAAGRTVRQFGSAIVRVSHPRGGPRVEVAPNVERIGWSDARRVAG